MRPVVVTVGPLAAASANGIATSQSVAAGSSVVISNPALDQPRRVLITSVGNDSGITFQVVGLNWSGAKISEFATGANAGAASTVLDYATVASITPSGATASTVTVGTTGVAGSPWVRLDNWTIPQTAVQLTVTGTVNYTLQQTLDDPNSPTNPVAPPAVTWYNSADPAAVGATASAQTNYAYVPCFARVLLNSGSGSVTATFTQAGDHNL